MMYFQKQNGRWVSQVHKEVVISLENVKLSDPFGRADLTVRPNFQQNYVEVNSTLFYHKCVSPKKIEWRLGVVNLIL